MHEQKFIEISESCFVDSDYEAAFSEAGLTSIDAVFSFNGGRNLSKNNLAKHRARLQFEINKPPVIVFLKRYDGPPISVQLRNWLAARGRVSCGVLDVKASSKLAAAGINTPKTLFYGEQRGVLFEKRSFVITKKIPNAESLERKLPDSFNKPGTVEKLRLRRSLIAELAAFVRKFHDTGYRHRDLYLSHVFYSDSGEFYLIDLSRVFRPVVRCRRFQIKDIAQLYYSAPAKNFSSTDRLRFYINYTGRNKPTGKDKAFIRKVVNKARRMARHEIKHGRKAPFES
jgi:hypothetical protein